MFELWFVELMNINSHCYSKIAFSCETAITYLKCKRATKKMKFYWYN
jgi:hypothetical protein